MEAFLRQGFIPFSDAVAREAGILASAAESLTTRAEKAARGLGKPSEVTFVGIGASLAALAGPSSYLSAHGVPAQRLNAAEAEAGFVRGTLVTLSQSGRSRESVSVMRNASGNKLAVVNVTDSPMAEAAEAVLSLGDLPDSLASTIGLTASIMAVSMLCEAWVEGRPAASWLSVGKRAKEFLQKNEAAIERVVELVSLSTSIDFVAPHEHSGIAEAGSLLIREVARKPTAPFETRQYLHGLMEANGPTTLHLLIEGPDEGRIVQALSSFERRIVEFRTSGESRPNKAPFTVDASKASRLELPIFIAMFLQQVVLRSASARGVDPDEFLFLDTGTKLGDGE